MNPALDLSTLVDLSLYDWQLRCQSCFNVKHRNNFFHRGNLPLHSCKICFYIAYRDYPKESYRDFVCAHLRYFQ